MKTLPLIRRRVVLAPDAFAEIVVWRVPEPVTPSSHALKYRLAYVVGGECVLRYRMAHQEQRQRRPDLDHPHVMPRLWGPDSRV